MKLPIPWFNKGPKKTGRLGVLVGPDGISFAYVNGQGELGAHGKITELGDPRELLAELVADNDWQDQTCSLVLHPAYYQLQLIDDPNVEKEELDQAVRWKTKDLLNFPLDQAALDYFPLPKDAYRGRQNRLYVAALQKSILQSLAEPLEEAGLELDCIEIAELALHNLASRINHETGGLAVLQLFGGESFINMVEDGQVYLTRRGEQGLEQFLNGGNPQAFLDSLMLELQRSLDFYESQLGKGIITHLYYSPANDLTKPIGDFLSQYMGLNIEPLPIEGLLKGELGTQTSHCLPAIGAALGPKAEEETADAAH